MQQLFVNLGMGRGRRSSRAKEGLIRAFGLRILFPLLNRERHWALDPNQAATPLAMLVALAALRTRTWLILQGFQHTQHIL